VVVSIGASVLLAGVLYPTRRGERWVGNKALLACGIGLLAWLLLGWLLLTDYRPPWTHYAGAWVALVGLVVAARLAPADLFAAPDRRTPGAVWFFLLAAFNTSAVVIGVGVTAENRFPPSPVTFAGLMLVEVVCLTLLVYWSGGGRAWNDRHRLAWVIGTLAFFIVVGGVIKDVGEWHGRSIVAVAATLVLWRLWRHVRRRSPAPAAHALAET
jgi:hypothetical protein